MPEVTTRLPGGDFRFAMTAGELIRYTPTGDRDRDVKVVTQMCISALEELIRRRPDQWLWAPRHWLDINRGHDAEYADWKPEIVDETIDFLMQWYKAATDISYSPASGLLMKCHRL